MREFVYAYLLSLQVFCTLNEIHKAILQFQPVFSSFLLLLLFFKSCLILCKTGTCLVQYLCVMLFYATK